MFTMIIWALVLVALVSYAYPAYIGAPWVPTKKHERSRLLELVDIKPGQTVYDLGSGNGAVLFDLARRFPEARYIGYELSLVPLVWGWITKMRHPSNYQTVSLRFGNAYRQDVRDADLLFIYLLDNNYHRLLKFLENAKLKPEAVVIIEGWPLPAKQYYFSNNQNGLLPLYFYRGSEFAIKE